MTITRDYGATAQDKSDELMRSLGFAVVTVVLLLAFTMGWREAAVVAIAVPLSFALALFVNYLFGYTINRVTMFALILSLGLVVDDPITNVDNIQRHILMGKKRPKWATLDAVNEVLPPVIMSTLAIIVSFTPMFFHHRHDGALHGAHGGQRAAHGDLFHPMGPYGGALAGLQAASKALAPFGPQGCRRGPGGRPARPGFRPPADQKSLRRAGAALFEARLTALGPAGPDSASIMRFHSPGPFAPGAA